MDIQTFDYSVDLLQVLLWEYNTAVNLQELATLKQAWYTEFQTEFWSEWFDEVFNIVTATQFGLSVWAIILGIPLEIQIPSVTGQIFGYGPDSGFPDTNGNYNFNNGNFSGDTSPFRLTVEEQRLLLRLRYFQLTSRTAIPEINYFWNIVFAYYLGEDFVPGSPFVYVVDGLLMNIRVVFTVDIPQKIIYLIKYFDLVPRSSGVEIEYVIDTGSVFGYGPDSGFPNSNGNVNFNNGNYAQVF
jgi:hypothetical protein